MIVPGRYEGHAVSDRPSSLLVNEVYVTDKPPGESSLPEDGPNASVFVNRSITEVSS